ncbi:hypothetical protein [Oceanobacter mangrovi]|uniref:hypothetical protein n=1 Tax=Oceanobacter mangrovi TaxID=2862510 RepID=UPI001C8DA53B|nr:hypothetical protein [Oceanobacter mangrovi]
MIVDFIYNWVGGLSMLIFLVSWVLFARLSVPAIDRRMIADGHDRACRWDQLGMRTFWIATAVAFPFGSILNNKYDPSIDGETVHQYGRRFDRALALILSLSGLIFIVILLLGLLLGWDQ